MYRAEQARKVRTEFISRKHFSLLLIDQLDGAHDALGVADTIPLFTSHISSSFWVDS